MNKKTLSQVAMKRLQINSNQTTELKENLIKKVSSMNSMAFKYSASEGIFQENEELIKQRFNQVMHTLGQTYKIAKS